MPLIAPRHRRADLHVVLAAGGAAPLVDGSVPGGAAVSLAPRPVHGPPDRDQPCDLRFRVTPDGLVELRHLRADHLLRGRGTTTLHVLGVPVTLTSGGGGTAAAPDVGRLRRPIRDAVHTRPANTSGRDYALRLGRLSREHLCSSASAGTALDYRGRVRDRPVRAGHRPPHRRPSGGTSLTAPVRPPGGRPAAVSQPARAHGDQGPRRRGR